jgi:hypothetical protein
MLEQKDIKHSSTKKAVLFHDIDISNFNTIEELRAHIKFIRNKKYQKDKSDYFREYMRTRYNTIPEVRERQKELREQKQQNKKVSLKV